MRAQSPEAVQWGGAHCPMVFESRVGVRYRCQYLGTGTGTWEMIRYRYRYRYNVFAEYLGTGTGTLGTGTGTGTRYIICPVGSIVVYKLITWWRQQ